MGDAGEQPNHRYYAALQGRWTAPFEFEVVDWGAFWASPLRVIDRVRVIGMVCSRALLGRPRIDTRVEVDDDARLVRHELRVSKWGVPFFHSRETFALHEDGRTLTITGEQRVFPLMLRAPLGDNPGEVDETSTRAHYALRWMGGRMQIDTQVVEGGADITMDAGWGRGVQRLRAPS